MNQKKTQNKNQAESPFSGTTPYLYTESPSEIDHSFCPVRSEKASYKGKRRHVLACMYPSSLHCL